ncbi:TPA: hypothetical protein U2E43_002120, partial [Streptococcus suis]|nr:hypothetical protein [Streptococcus suis]
STNKLSYDLDGNGAVLLDKSLVLAYGTDFLLWNSTKNENYHFDMTGKFSYYYTNDIDNKKYDSQYQKEAELLLDKILPPILEAQPKPKINLQNLFNEKYYKQFNE